MAKWERISARGNVEDRRSFGAVAGGVGVTGMLLFAIFNYLAGASPEEVLNQLASLPDQTQYQDTLAFEGEDAYEVFASTVLGSNNELWQEEFDQSNLNYQEPRLVLFRAQTQSSCGGANSLVGPHYCPLDQTIYLDETFFDELQTRFGAHGGDVAQAYVISHEVGHHVQNLLGDLQVSETNEDSVKTELQADCYAGVWANSINDKQLLLPGEIDEAIDAAASVGDDRIQETITGRVDPENFTHGTSEERVFWFNRGFETGLMSMCDTAIAL